MRVALGHVQLTAGKNESRGIYYIGGETVGDTQTKGASRGLSLSRGVWRGDTPFDRRVTFEKRSCSRVLVNQHNRGLFAG